MADRLSGFSSNMRHAASTGERQHINGAFRRTAIERSKSPRMTARALRARRMKDAVQKAKAERKAALNRRFKERLARVKAAAGRARVSATSAKSSSSSKSTGS